MKPESAFADLNIDAMTGVRLMEALGLSTIDFSNPARFTRLSQVIDFLRQYPEDTQNFLISRVTTGKMGDRLDKVFEYTQLLERKRTVEQSLETVKKEASVIPLEADPILRESIARREIETFSQLQSIGNEIAVYEK